MGGVIISNVLISNLLFKFLLEEVVEKLKNRNELTITFNDFCEFLTRQKIRLGIDTTKMLWETAKAEIKKMGYKIKQYSTYITIYKELPEEERKKTEETEEILSIYGINPISLIKAIFEYRVESYFSDIIEKTPANQELNDYTFLSILSGVFSHLPILVINDFHRLFLISKQHFLVRLSWHIRNLKSIDIQLEHISVTISEIKTLYSLLKKVNYIEKEIKIGNKNFVVLSPIVVYEGFVKQLFLFLKNLRDKKGLEEKLREEKDIESKITNLSNFLKQKYPIFTTFEELKKENFIALPLEIRLKCSLCNNLKDLKYVNIENEDMLICNDCFEKLQ